MASCPGAERYAASRGGLRDSAWPAQRNGECDVTCRGLAKQRRCVYGLTAQGLWDAQKNIRALRSTGGNVEAAIELIFSGQLDNAPQ
jgi:hypothetical protein